jgi:hypothetical protein
VVISFSYIALWEAMMERRRWRVAAKGGEGGGS